MITLNAEKELVRIENWENIVERVDYVRDIDPSTISLESIIGSYVFADPVPCGLSTCHQPHNKGYLVTTKSKHVTNIGNLCGKKHFSIDFQTLRNKFNRDIRVKTQKEALQAFLSRVPGYEAQITELRQDKDGDWVYKYLKRLKTPNSGVPEKIRYSLNDMLKTGSNQITIQRLATVEERQTQEVTSMKSREGPLYVEEKQGSLAGITALREENNIRKILIEDIQSGIERIVSMDIEAASDHQLSVESKWAGEIEAKLERAETAVLEGRRLLELGNLQQLLKLLDMPEDKVSFKKFLVEISQNR